jgi:hypothetical protein
VDWIHLTKDKTQWQALVSTVMNLISDGNEPMSTRKCREFLSS